MTDATASGSDDQAITDERLGVFARDAQPLSDGGVLYHSFRGSAGPPTADDFADARNDLSLNTIAVKDGDEVVLHFTDSCGRHFLDGYWPAVRFDRDDTVLDVTVEA
ncbi:MAG TPA: hypothetical protein VFV01_30825 [Spirillospora sp.]|nr:hypothetical protein [Spirillospora sp.]